jgi:hypothetical protein
MDWTFPANGPLKADLELAAGSVELELSATDEIRVLLEPEGRDSDLARDQIANASVTCDGSRLDVRVPKRKLREASLHLRVLVPAGSAARIRTASADIACAGPLATFEAKSSSGDITVQDVCEAASISTASGDIRLAAVLGELDVQTASGDVMTQSIGGRASVTTASGDIRVASVAHDARLRTASGDVSVGCAYEGDLSANTASGDVRIGVGSGVGTWLDLITVSGDSACTLPAEGQGEGGAELRISCRTVSGDILVHSGEPAPGGRGGPGGARDAGGDGGGDGPGASESSGLGTDSPVAGSIDSPELPNASSFPAADATTDDQISAGRSDAATFGLGDAPRLSDLHDLHDLSDFPDFPDSGGVRGVPTFAKLAELADLAGFGDVADLMLGRPTTGQGIRLPWRRT